MEKNRVFTGRCIVLSRSYSPEQLLWRTLQLSLFEGLEQYLVRYPKLGMMRSGVLYERVISEPLIRDPDGSALHTRERLDSILTMNGCYLPTPLATVNNNPHTPAAWNRDREPCILYAKAFGITKEEAIGQGFQLNPLFVEEMMGFPTGWTDVEP